MENVCISDKYGVAIGTSDNPVYIQGSAGGGVPITIPSGSEFPMVRGNEQVTLTYAASTDPTSFIDKRKYAMVVVQIPAAANGLTMTPLAAENTGG